MKTEQVETAERFLKECERLCDLSNGEVGLYEVIITRLKARDRAKLLEGMRAMKEAIAKNFEGRDRCTGDRECASNIREIDPAAVLAEMEKGGTYSGRT